MNFRMLALAALLPASFVFAHDFGQDYDKARMAASTSIEIVPGKTLSIASNAIHWRKDLFDAVKSGGTKRFFGGTNAWLRKVGEAKVPEPMQLGGQLIAAGDWTVSIKVPADDTAKFLLEWKQGDKSIDVPLTMKGGGEVEDHLFLGLTPRGDNSSKAFALKVAYGDLSGSIAGTFDSKAQ